jgi:hypothetical protein
MINDLDELRSVLRMRADLAPNPDDMIPATRKLARRRQVRRRAMGLGGAVILTVLALAGTTLLGRTHPVPPMPGGGPLVTPTFPFSVSTLPDSLRLRQTGWVSTGGDPTTQAFSSYSMNFGGSIGPITNQVTIQWLRHEPVLQLGPTDSQSAYTWHGVMGSMANRKDQAVQHWDAIWPVGAQAWIDVTTTSSGVGYYGFPAVIDIVNAITTRPSLPLVPVHVPHLPAGFTVFNWQHSVLGERVQDDVDLCSRLTKSTGEQGCFQVIVGSGDFARARTSSGRVVTRGRQVDAGHWIGVYPAQVSGVDPAELDGLLREASIG